MWSLTALALALAACNPGLALHGSHSSSVRPPGGRGSIVDLPPTGDARPDVLGSGWPVWVVRHGDGSATVVSAVAQPRPSSASHGALVRWLPATRRFLAGDVLYDEYGRVLGYATDDSCVTDCPRVSDPALDERNLDRFTAVVAFERMIVDELVPAQPRDDAPDWIDWDRDIDRSLHATRELAVGGDQVSPVAFGLADALRVPLGSYAIIAASIVQSTTAAPHICADTPRCAACDASSPLAFGVPRSPVSEVAVHAESGTILIRREPTGLAVIATSRARACSI
jgi:hypothetical protein